MNIVSNRVMPLIRSPASVITSRPERAEGRISRITSLEPECRLDRARPAAQPVPLPLELVASRRPPSPRRRRTSRPCRRAAPGSCAARRGSGRSPREITHGYSRPVVRFQNTQRCSWWSGSRLRVRPRCRKVVLHRARSAIRSKSPLGAVRGSRKAEAERSRRRWTKAPPARCICFSGLKAEWESSG